MEPDPVAQFESMVRQSLMRRAATDALSVLCELPTAEIGRAMRKPPAIMVGVPDPELVVSVHPLFAAATSALHGPTQCPAGGVVVRMLSGHRMVADPDMDVLDVRAVWVRP
jgi:hypothetical protein